MFGIIFASIGSFFEEVFSVIGKKEIRKHEESIYSMGFLLYFWSVIFFLAIILLKGSFDFSLASLPTFITRVVLEVFVVTISLHALVKSDRSTFSFIRTITLPLLLLVDFFLGYTLTFNQIFGISIIIFSLLILFLNHGVSKRGLKYVIISAILAVGTISLFKYNITNFNSVEAEQFLAQSILLIYFFIMAKTYSKENPLKLMRKSLIFKQSLSEGLGAVLISFAYVYAPASVITSAKRSSSVLWAVLSGNRMFHEKHIVLKLTLFVMLTVGIILLFF